METATTATTVASTTASVASETIKKGWWASRSKITKGLIITGIVLAVATGVYLLVRPKDSDSNKRKKSDSDDSNSNESQSNDDVSNNETNDDGNSTVNESNQDSENQSEQSQSSENNSNQKKQGIVYDASTLPNSGEGCSEPRLNYDGNYDYVKCNGVWYVKSKQNPKTPSIAIPVWAGLKPDSVRANRLSSRYPND